MATIKSMVGTLNKQSVFQIGEFYSLPRFCDLLEGTKWKNVVKNIKVFRNNLKEIVQEPSGILNIISQIKGYIRDNPDYSIYVLEVESKEEVLKWEPYQLSIQFPKNVIIYCEDGAFNAVAGRGHKTDITTFNNMLRVCQYVTTPLSKWIHTQAIELLGNFSHTSYNWQVEPSTSAISVRVDKGKAREVAPERIMISPNVRTSEVMQTIQAMVNDLNRDCKFRIGDFYSLTRFAEILQGSSYNDIMKNLKKVKDSLEKLALKRMGKIELLQEIYVFVRDNPQHKIYPLEVATKEDVLEFDKLRDSHSHIFPRTLLVYYKESRFNSHGGHKTPATTFDNMLLCCEYVDSPRSRWIRGQSLALLGRLFRGDVNVARSIIEHVETVHNESESQYLQANQGNTLTVVELKRYLKDISGMYFGGSKSSDECYKDAIKLGITKNLHQRLWNPTHIRQYEVLYTLVSPDGFNYEYIKQCEKAMKRTIRTKDLQVKRANGTPEHEIFRKDSFAETYSCEDEEIYPMLISAATKVLSHLSSESTESFKLFKKIGDAEWTPIDAMGWYENDFELDVFEALNGDDEIAQASKRKATEEEDLEIKKLRITTDLETKKLDHELQSKKLDYQYKMLEKLIEKDYHKALELFSKMF